MDVLWQRGSCPTGGRARGVAEPRDLPGCPPWGDPAPRDSTRGWAGGLRQESAPYAWTRLTAAPAPSCRNGVSSKESTCRDRPGDPAGSHPGPKAGSVPTVTSVPFWPRCNDSTPIFPGGTPAPALPSSSHFPSTAGERDRPSVPASSPPQEINLLQGLGTPGLRTAETKPVGHVADSHRGGSTDLPDHAATGLATHAATSAKACSLRCGPRRQLGKI